MKASTELYIFTRIRELREARNRALNGHKPEKPTKPTIKWKHKNHQTVR